MVHTVWGYSYHHRKGLSYGIFTSNKNIFNTRAFCLESEFLEQESKVGGFIVGALSSGEISVFIFEDVFQFFLEFLSLISSTESFFSDDSLEIDFSTELVSKKYKHICSSKE